MRKVERDIDRVILWHEIESNKLIIDNLGHMNTWKPTNQYVKIDEGVYRHYLVINKFAAPIDKFINRYGLDIYQWTLYPYGYFPNGFFDIFKNEPSMDLERALKYIDIRLRRKDKRITIDSVYTLVMVPKRIQVLIDFGSNDKACIDLFPSICIQ